MYIKILHIRKFLSFCLSLIIFILGGLVFLRLTVKADSLIGFNEGYGSTIHDSKGSVSGTITNAVWKFSSECLSGACLFFDGSGDFVSFGPEASFNFAAATNWTIELWFRTTPISSGTRVLISKYNSVAGYKIYMSSDGKINFGVDDDATWQPDDIATSANRYDDNNWHQISVSKTGTSNITLYIDALKVAQKNSLTATGSLSSSANFCVGGDSDCTTNGWLGYIDELKVVVASARTANQIETDYQKGITTNGTNVRFGPDTSYLTQGLVGYWKMDETASWSGTLNEVTDSSGNGNHGQAKGATGGKAYQKLGKFNKGGFFDGVDDSVNVPNSASIQNLPNGDFTAVAWFKADTLPTASNDIAHFISKSESGTFHWHLGFRGTGAHNQLDATIDNVAYSRTSDLTDAVSTGIWYHYVMTFSQKEKLIHLYLNGSEVSYLTQSPLTGSYSGDSSVALTLGATYSVGGFFNGTIDDVRIYNRALSPAEISQLYNWAPGPVGYWKLDEYSNGSSSVTRADSSGNNNNLSDGKYVPSATGKFGSAANFTRSKSQYINIADASQTDLDLSGPSTLCAWFNPTSQTSYNNIMGKYNSTSNQRAYKFYISGNKLHFDVTPDGNDNWTGAYAATTISNNTWYYGCGVYTGSQIQVYLNGTLDTNGVHNPVNYSSGIFNSSADFTISDRHSGDYFDGLIDNAIAYNYARSPSQIIEDMNAGHPAPGSPVGSATIRYKFDEGYGNTANDTGATGAYPGTLLSGAGHSASEIWRSDCKFEKCIRTWGSSGNDWGGLVGLGDLSLFDSLNQMTLSTWIRPNTLTANRILFAKSNMPLTLDGGTQNCFNVRTDSSSLGDIRVYIASSLTDYSNYYKTSNLGLTNNTWAHLVIVYDGTETAANRVKVYKNGVLVNGGVTGTIPASLVSGSTTNFYLGGSDGPGIDAFIGLFDEFKLYTSVLTADQVRTEYNRGFSVVMGAVSMGSAGQATSSASSTYCIPSDSASCAAPIHYFNLDENTGNDSSTLVVYDSGTNPNIELVPPINDYTPKWSTGVYGSALKFDGVDDRVSDLNSNPGLGLNGATKASWMGWIKRRTANSYVTFGDTDLNSPKHGEVIEAYNDGNIYATLGTGSTWADGYFSSNDTQWHHVAAVFDGTQTGNANRLKMYLDGKPQSLSFSGASIPSSLSEDTSPFVIGEYCDGCGAPITDGWIDDVRVYDYVRTPAQIAWDYNRGAPVTWYRFDEGTGSIAHDAAPKADNITAGYDGTITIGGNGTQTTTAQAWSNGAVGKYNASLNLDGNDDYITTSAFSPLAGTGGSVTKVSWDGWFNPASSVVSKTLIEKASEFRLVTDSSGNPVCGVYPFTSASAATASAALGLSSWSHITCTYDGSNITIFVNGNPTAVKPYTNSIIAASSILYMGESSDATQRYQGQLDDIRLYNYSLTPTQIKTLYNGSAIKF